MPRARPATIIRQTAAVPQEQGSGCLSYFILAPFTVLFISAFLASFAWNINSTTGDLPPVTSTSISPIFRIEIHYWADSISRWAGVASQLDPNLVATIMQIESCGDPRARSSSGAMGLFQVMPFHFYAIDDPYNPDINAARGLSYLTKSLAAGGGDIRFALAGYNGGIGLIGRAEWTWPDQTKRYVQYGAPIYEDTRNRLTSSTAINEWYENMG